MSQEPIWSPSIDRTEQSNMMRIMKHCGISDYNEFYTWSIQNISAFWNLIWDFCGIIAQEKGLYVLENETDMEHARFFPDAKLNYAENLLRNTGQETAIVFWGEDKVKRHLTHDELRADVAAVAAGLRKSGVKAGDCVAGIVPNTPEAVIAMLATASIGAVWASCSPDFGVQGILDRFEQINPKILFTANAYYYNSKTFDCVPKLCEIVDKLPSLKKVVVFSYAKAPQGTIPKAVSWRSFTEGHEGVALKFEPLPFNHPLFIMFSSGTTGKPKCIVHGAGGTLIQHLKEHQLHSDIKPGDRVFYFTTCGWMMWNWLVSSLASGATLLLYDGSPIAPDNNILFDYADAEQMTLFGTSAKYIDALNKAGTKPMETHDLGSIRMMCSTGSPLVPQAYDYVYENIKKDICLASISGGTDILSCFALGNPIAPVWRGELQTRGLGLAVNVFDENGKPITQEKGELVCTKPFPCQPLGFWDDEDGKKYHTAYFNVFPNIWHHGDFVELTEHGGLIFYGRSDAVLNPGGIRIGTAEIYRQVEAIHEVLESICVGQDWQGDVRVILFVKLRPGMTLDENLIARIRTNIRENASPRHVPAKIIQVEGIPRTLSGKIVELAVREVIHNRPVKNIEALANPEALDYFKDLPELKTA